MKKVILFIILLVVLINCGDSNPIIDNQKSEVVDTVINDPKIEGVYIESLNQWSCGSKLRGKYISDNQILINWDIHERELNISEFRVLRKAWHEQEFKLVKTLPPNSLSFQDNNLPTSIKNVWHYVVYADKKDKAASSSSQITIWKMNDYYNQPTTYFLNNTKLWVTNAPGNSLSPESRFCLTDLKGWSQLSERTDGIMFYRNSIREATQAEINNLRDIKKNHQIKIGMETGGFQFVTETNLDELGEKSFESELRAIANLTSAGEKLDDIFFDGPIHRALYGGEFTRPRMTISKASEELTDMMLLYRNYNPEIKFYLISNFSNWGWKGTPARNTNNIGEMGFGDYKLVLDTLLNVANSRGVRFEGISIDYSYEAFLNEGSSNQINVIKDVDYKLRLKELYNYIKEKEYQFVISLNSNRGGNSNNIVFKVEVFNYLEELLRMNIVPDQILHQSWGKYPDKWIGENDENTFTNIGLKLSEKYKIRK